MARRAIAAPDGTPEATRSLGGPTAMHTVIECFSLTCPHCADFALNSLPALEAKWIAPGRLRWVFYDLPTDGAALQAAQKRWNVNATPGFVIDGKLYEGAMSADAFSQILGS